MTTIDLLAGAAARFADRPAIERADGEVVTYAALWQHARQRAATLRGPLVEIEAARTVDFVVACLGAWLAGLPWTPRDRRDPRWPVSGEGRDDDEGSFAQAAYAIPTSGSTGRPRLVVVDHAGLPALLHAQVDAFELAADARALWLHAPMFDASVSDVFTVLLAGATLVVPSRRALSSPARLRSELLGRAITHVDLPPSMLAHLPADDLPPGLRVVVLGGEPCPVEAVRALARRCRVVVVYGPTEATVCSSLIRVDPARWTRPLIGDPLPGITYRVIDGELWIGGPAVARGYAGDPAATAARFVVRDGVRMFRTGDRVEPFDGGLAFLGRIDRQHKVAGRRVELGEIEATLRRAPGVTDAAALVRAVQPASRARVIGFIEGAAAPDDVRRWLATQLPPWMVPARIVATSLPRGATGKLDYQALEARAPVGARPLPGGGVASELAAVWCDALDREIADLDERFSDAGGDSLAALSIHAATAALGLELAAEVFDGDPTLRELVDGARSATGARLAVAECARRGGEAWRVVSGSSSPRPPRPGADGAVVITGATGHLGRHLLRAWRATDRRPIVAIVRAHDDAAARARLGSLADDLDVEVVRGDLTRPGLGLTPERWNELAARATTIVHAAAAMQLGGGWDTHAPANVGGTAEVARLGEASGAALHHISTLSVFVGTTAAPARHEDRDAPRPDDLALGGYAQTKIAAEAIIAGLRGRAAPTTIHRLGLLVGGGPRDHDQLSMTMRGLARLGCVPNGVRALRLDLTPVVVAAAAVRALAARAERTERDDTHHVATSRGVEFGRLLEALRRAHVELPEVSPSDWIARARTQLARPEVAMAYVSLGRLHPDETIRTRLRPFDLFLATGHDLGVERTSALLAEAGDLSAPEAAIDPTWLDALVADAARPT